MQLRLRASGLSSIRPHRRHRAVGGFGRRLVLVARKSPHTGGAAHWRLAVDAPRAGGARVAAHWRRASAPSAARLTRRPAATCGRASSTTRGARSVTPRHTRTQGNVGTSKLAVPRLLRATLDPASPTTRGARSKTPHHAHASPRARPRVRAQAKAGSGLRASPSLSPLCNRKLLWMQDPRRKARARVVEAE